MTHDPTAGLEATHTQMSWEDGIGLVSDPARAAELKVLADAVLTYCKANHIPLFLIAFLETDMETPSITPTGKGFTLTEKTKVCAINSVNIEEGDLWSSTLIRGILLFLKNPVPFLKSLLKEKP